MHAIIPVGYLPDGTPVWPIAGGAGEGEGQGAGEGGEGSGEGSGQGDGAGQPEGGQPSGQSGDGSGQGQGDGQGEGQPSPLEQQAQEAIDQLKQAGQEVPQALERAVNEFRNARREAANYRTQSKEAQQQQADAMRQLAKAFGIEVADDQPPDPKQLQSQIEQSQSSERQARVELAAYRKAAAHDADPDALLDSRTFLDKVAKLDPSADDFDGQLDAAVKASVEANPKLKQAAPGGGRNGPPQGPQPPGSEGPKDLRSALAENLAPQ